MLFAPLIASNDFQRSKKDTDGHNLQFLSVMKLFVDRCLCMQKPASKILLPKVFAPFESLTFHNQPNSTIKKITKFVQESGELASRFITACLQTFNERKKQTVNFYFRLLGYSTIFSTRGKEVDTELDMLRLKNERGLQEALPHCRIE